MNTECNSGRLEFQPLAGRRVEADFDGGEITSDAGGLLLREAERITGAIGKLAACFTDYRDPELTEHSVETLLAQRIQGVALGYEDLNDHDELRRDTLLAAVAGAEDLAGVRRRCEADRGAALAGKSTLNRLELTPADASAESRYKKIVADEEQIAQALVDLFLEAHPQPPASIVLDLDATDDPLHGKQEGRFFHGYYKEYCYLPLYIFAGEFLLCAKLRTADRDASAGSVEELERIVAAVRAKWPEVKITIRGDSGFCREEIMAWCEANGVDYVLGLAKNPRLGRRIATELEEAKTQFEETGQAARVFTEFTYQTRDSWSRRRRVVAKAEHLRKGANPRFVVTPLSEEEYDARTLYEEVYCARGEMENRIKEQQLMLFADRTSTHAMRANQLRLWFSSIAYCLMHTVRRLGLKGTELERAQCSTIRSKLLKVGAQVRVSVRRLWLSLASGYPYQTLFRRALANLRAAPAALGPD